MNAIIKFMALYESAIFVLLLLPTIVIPSAAPWQTHSMDALEETWFNNMPPTTFSSNGRLTAVERMASASSNSDDMSSNVVVAISLAQGVLVLCSSTLSPHLDEDNCTDTTSLLSLRSSRFLVGPHVYAATAGNAADSQILLEKVLQTSFSLWERTSGGSPLLPPSLLARSIADHLQRPTQQVSSGKILASQALVWDAFSIWQVDPSGQFWKCSAAAIGRSHHTVESALVEKYNHDLSLHEAIHLVVEAIQNVVPKQRRLYGILVRKDTSIFPLTHEMLTQMGNFHPLR